MNKTTKNILITTLLIAAAVAWRIINHNYSIAPNLEIVTAVSVLAALMIGFRGAIIVSLSSMIVSDLFIGNSSIFIFTWSSFLAIGILATVLKKLDQKLKMQILGSFGFAIFSSFLFFVVTNFGVWLQGWYPATFAGLISCFTMAIPFYRTMLVGNMIIVPSSVMAWQMVKSHQIAKSSITSKIDTV